MITRPSVLTPEDLRKIADALASSGARISMEDKRVSSVQTWVLATIGVTLVGVGGWGIRSIDELNKTMTKVVTANEYRDAQANRMERHLETLDGRVVNLEKKVR